MDSALHPLVNQSPLSIFLHLGSTPFCGTILQCIPTWNALIFKINVCCYAKGKSILTSYGVTFYYPLHLYSRNDSRCNFVPLFKRWPPLSQLPFIFERDKRLELSPWPWKGRMLPLQQSRITKPKCLMCQGHLGIPLSREQESNLQPADYRSAALPIELSRHR